MNLEKLLLVLPGVFDLAFAVFHLGFWRIFGWREELPRLSFANRGILQVLNLCLTYVFVVMAATCLLVADDLTTSGLGRFLLGSFALFWALRAIYQPVFFGLKHPLSIGLFVAFLLGTAIHLLPLLGFA
jgi:tryptophan-rich sensory protein